MDRYRVSYSALPTFGMSDENSISPSSGKINRSVNFPPDTSDPCLESNFRYGSKFLQRPRSLSVWSTSSIASRTSNKFDER